MKAVRRITSWWCLLGLSTWVGLSVLQWHHLAQQVRQEGLLTTQMRMQAADVMRQHMARCARG